MIKTNNNISQEESKLFSDLHVMENQIDALELVKALSYRVNGHSCKTDLESETHSELYSERVFGDLYRLIERENYVYGFSNRETDPGCDLYSQAIVINFDKYYSLKLVCEALYNKFVDKTKYTLITSVLPRENEQDRIVDLNHLIETLNDKYVINQELPSVSRSRN